ncbi:unnamed protein product [Ambrosiozyma monospora]|uniref:Unnamed protein product n=1 Tax=Ambrosiozyma monospora TaxID=43982 RepID=A0ACB5T3U5_AMBMO|nr:unnamed protein product [Ambrosiozyma monospora]
MFTVKRLAISTGTLHLRANKVFVSTGDLAETDCYAYVFPKNLLSKFIRSSDTRTQIAGYLFGKSPDDRDDVKEIRSIVLFPQIGDNHHVEFPSQLPESPYLEGLEPLGWVHTLPSGVEEGANETSELLTHTKMVTNFRWDTKSAAISVSFTSGSVTLTSYTATKTGYRWAAQNLSALGSSVGLANYSPSYKKKTPLILVDSFKGFFMVPDTNIWNYSFIANSWSEEMEYDIKLDQPIPFYHELHRPLHFVNFNQIEANNDLEADQEDVFA